MGGDDKACIVRWPTAGSGLPLSVLPLCRRALRDRGITDWQGSAAALLPAAGGIGSKVGLSHGGEGYGAWLELDPLLRVAGKCCSSLIRKVVQLPN